MAPPHTAQTLNATQEAKGGTRRSLRILEVFLFSLISQRISRLFRSIRNAVVNKLASWINECKVGDGYQRGKEDILVQEKPKKLIALDPAHVISTLSLKQLEEISRDAKSKPTPEKLILLSTGVSNTIGCLWSGWLAKGDITFQAYSKQLKQTMKAVEAVAASIKKNSPTEDPQFASDMETGFKDYVSFVEKLLDTETPLRRRRDEILGLHDKPSVGRSLHH